MLAAIIGAVNAGTRRRAALRSRSRAGRDRCIQSTACARRDRDIDLRKSLRQPVGQRPPMIAAVSRFEQAAVRTVEHVLVFPRPRTRIPESRVQGVGIEGIDPDEGSAGILALVQHFGPGGAAVHGSVQAALRARAIGVAQYRCIDAVGIMRIDRNAGNLLRVVERQMHPGMTAVVRAVDAVADR